MRVVILFLFIGLFACESKRQTTKRVSDCKPYFTYTSVDHYQIQIDEDLINDLENKNHDTHDLAPLQADLLTFLTSLDDISLADTAWIADLGEMGYAKYNLDEAQFETIDSVFCRKLKPVKASFKMCIPRYRDVLIFKTHNQIVGMVKLCFSCNMGVLAGTKEARILSADSWQYEILAPVLRVEYPVYD